MSRAFFAIGLAAAGADVLPAADTFVHLFEWSWPDVAQECEQWLAPKGFKAVQVSPPMEHISGEQWWTRYQPVSFNLTSRSGSEEAFKDMVSRCKQVGVDVIVDTVFNHVAGGSGVGIAGSPYGSRRTVLFEPTDFHHDASDVGRNCGITNWADKHNVQYCDLVGLPDLCTGCPRVQEQVAQHLRNLTEMGVAGFRVDAAKHIDTGELKDLLMKTGSLPWLYSEVMEAVGEAVTAKMYEGLGKVTEFNYARHLAPNFIQEGKLKYLNTVGEGWGFIASSSAVVFMDNHDSQRGEAKLTYKSGALYYLANVFMLAHPYGYPMVMSSYFFEDKDQGPPSTPVHGQPYGFGCDNGPWVCEHRHAAVANMVAWRRSAGANGLEAFQFSDDGNGAFFCRGASACVALNRGASSWKVSVKATMPAGSYRDVIRDADVTSCPTVEVKSDGTVDLEVPAMSAVAFHTNASNATGKWRMVMV